MASRFVSSHDDLLDLLDALIDPDRRGTWWDRFLTTHAGDGAFLVDYPDENLVEWFDQGLLTPGRALELGCGPGRNAEYLAGRGCRVEAIDFSPTATERAQERLRAAGVSAHFQCCSVFDAEINAKTYDLVYDSGCFHHLPPHRRPAYVDLVCRALKPGGHFGLVCFRPEGGSGLDDRQVYQQRTLGGGLGYSAGHLRTLWGNCMSISVLRPMRATADEPLFGHDFLWALLAKLTD